MSLSGGRGGRGWVALPGLGYWADGHTGSSLLADGHRHPPSPSTPRLPAQLSRGSSLPSPRQPGAAWAHPEGAGCALSALGEARAEPR